MATAKRDLKKKCKKEFVTLVVIEGIFLLYLGMAMGATYLALNPDRLMNQLSLTPTIVDVCANFIPYIKEHPFGLWPVNFLYVGIAFLIWFACLMYHYQAYIHKFNTMFQDAHGSAGFNDDIPKFLRWFVLDPQIIGGRKKDVGSGKKITRKKVRYRIENKITVFRKLLCKITPNTISPVKLKECYLKTFILSNLVALSTNARWTQRNLNILVLGAPGTGKSRGIIKPNILQANASYIITDPSGELLLDCGGFLKKKGYKIKIFNLKDLNCSNRYNPVAYVKSQADIPKLVECMLAGLNGEKKSGGDNKFWDDAAKNLMTACIAYMFEVYTDENEFNKDGTLNPYWQGNKNFINVMRMLRMAEIHEDEGATISDLDKLFAELSEKNYNSYAVRNYQTFKMSSDKTALNILISTAVGLGTFFDNDDFANISYRDELDLESIGREKTSVFIILPEGDNTYNFFASVMFTQLFQTLYAQAEENARKAHKPDPFLNVPVQFLVDEAANIGKIPNFNMWLSTMRKYMVSVCMIFQTMSQIKTYDKDGWETMTTDCDSWVYLGGAEQSTLKMLSEKIGKFTVNTYSYGEGKNGSANRQQIARNVLDPNEIEAMDNADALVFVRGTSPFFDKKYDFSKHPNYKYTAGSGTKHSIPFYIEDYKTQYDENEVNKFLVYAYGHPKHVEPKMLDKYRDQDLPIDSFSRKLDKRTETLSNGEMHTWRDTVEVVENNPSQEKQQKQQPLQSQAKKFPTEEQVSNFNNVNDTEKKEIERKINEITSQQYINISENQFKILMHIKDDCSEEEILDWCVKNLEVKSGFSPSYEFEPENDFIINNESSEEQSGHTDKGKNSEIEPEAVSESDYKQDGLVDDLINIESVEDEIFS